MPVYIYDEDALTRMAAIEGRLWMDRQKTQLDSPYGFYAFLNAYVKNRAAKAGQQHLYEDEDLLKPDGGTGEIYGQDGIDRYVVMGDGEVLFSSYHARQERRDQAEELGFRLSY